MGSQRAAHLDHRTSRELESNPRSVVGVGVNNYRDEEPKDIEDALDRRLTDVLLCKDDVLIEAGQTLSER